MGTLRLLEAIRDAELAGPLLPGRQQRDVRQGRWSARRRETTPFYPRSPYAVAKVFAHWMTVKYREAYGMFAAQRHPVQPRVAAARRDVRDPQDHPRRRRDPRRAASSKLYLGNLDARRDWGYAPEYVEAMWLMLQQDRAGRLRGRDRRDAQRPRVRRARLRPGRPRLARTTCEIDPRYFRPTEVDELLRRCHQGARAARLAAADDVPRAGPDDARGRPAPRRASTRIASCVAAVGRLPAMSAVAGRAGHGHRRRRLPRPARRRRGSPRAGAAEVFVPRQRDVRPADARRHRRARWPTAARTSSSTSRRSSAASAPTARTRAASSTRTRSWASSSWSRRGWPASTKFVTDRHGLLVPQVHAGPVPRGRPVGRLPRGDERAVRPRQEDAARPGPGLPRSSTASTSIYLIPVNLYGPGDNFDPASLARHPGADQEVRRCARGRREPHRRVGHRQRLARVPLRRRRRRGHRPGRRALRRRRAGEPRRRARDHDPRARRR